MTEEFHTIRERMTNILKKEFSPSFLNVIDDSHKHAGHAGHDGKGDSHFRLEIASAVFNGKSRIDAHRAIYAALEELIPPVHALQIRIRAENA